MSDVGTAVDTLIGKAEWVGRFQKQKISLHVQNVWRCSKFPPRLTALRPRRKQEVPHCCSKNKTLPGLASLL